MISLLLGVFLLNVFIHLFNTLGASTINELLWVFYNKLPTPTAKDAHEAARLRKEVLRLKGQMNAVSAQDDFAKWAKLRRAHDKAVSEQEKSAAAVQNAKAQFDRIAGIVRWISTNGLRYLLQFWFSKKPLFWLPQGWVPGYVEWLLAFPRAPKGSISIQLWGIACASIISMVSESVVALYTLATKQTDAKTQKQEPQAFKSGGESPSQESKKEL